MEEKKIDINSIIGIILISGILFWIMYQNQPDPKVVAAEKAQKELVLKAQKAKELANKAVEKATEEYKKYIESLRSCFKITVF